jgi:cytochrome c biogenesis protein CcmG/thiol:disulfide interchange protein DsbE
MRALPDRAQEAAMDAPALTQVPAAVRAPRRDRLATLAVMGVTAVIIAAVAVLVNQPSSTAGGLTSVTLNGEATGAAPTVGQSAPDFAATTVEGKAVKLSDFRGKPVWLTFGASWCQPCRAENPDIKATAEKHASSGLVVLAIFISEDGAAVKDYADRIGLGYLKVADPATTISSQYRILGIPSHFFIDSAGVLRSMKIGSLDVPAMEQALNGLR